MLDTWMFADWSERTFVDFFHQTLGRQALPLLDPAPERITPTRSNILQYNHNVSQHTKWDRIPHIFGKTKQV
jgi:hypothetical protein